MRIQSIMSLLQRAKKSGRKFLNPVPTEMGGPRIFFKALPRMIFPEPGRMPSFTPGPFVTDPAVYSRPDGADLRVTWFGHSSTLVEVDGVRILIDPVWDQRAAPVQWAGPKRFFPPTLPLQNLPDLDAVLLSHDHYDHLGAGTVAELARARPGLRWITSLAVGNVLQRIGVAAGAITELDWTESAEVTGKAGTLRITSVPARHFSGRSPFDRFETLWASFVLAGPRHRVYYGADSGLWDGYSEIGARFGPFDLTLLEIGAFDRLWAEIHLGPDGAAEAFARLGAKGLLMPIHWGLFNLGLHAWQQPIERMLELADAQGLRLFLPEPGRPEPVRELRTEWWRQG